MKNNYRKAECCGNCVFCESTCEVATYMGSWICTKDGKQIPEDPFDCQRGAKPSEEMFTEYEKYIEEHELKEGLCGTCDKYDKIEGEIA